MCCARGFFAFACKRVRGVFRGVRVFAVFVSFVFVSSRVRVFACSRVFVFAVFVSAGVFVFAHVKTWCVHGLCVCLCLRVGATKLLDDILGNWR